MKFSEHLQKQIDKRNAKIDETRKAMAKYKPDRDGRISISGMVKKQKGGES